MGCSGSKASATTQPKGAAEKTLIAPTVGAVEKTAPEEVDKPPATADIICQPCGTDAPTTALGPEGSGAKMYVSKLVDGRTVTRIVLQKDFDWRASVKQLLPGCPDWCPATHFGYLESGELSFQMQDGTTAMVKAGESYLIPPGHLPVVQTEAVMVEFAQEQVYTTEEFIENEAAVAQAPVAIQQEQSKALEEEADVNEEPDAKYWSKVLAPIALKQEAQKAAAVPEVLCQPCGSDVPTKVLGPDGAGAKMYMNKLADGRTVNRIVLEKGFDWRSVVKPIMPGCPDWCPATHFGYVESGEMGFQMQNGTKGTVKAGQAYLIPPGHLPIVENGAVMVEFAQEQVYTTKAFIENEASTNKAPTAPEEEEQVIDAKDFLTKQVPCPIKAFIENEASINKAPTAPEEEEQVIDAKDFIEKEVPCPTKQKQ